MASNEPLPPPEPPRPTQPWRVSTHVGRQLATVSPLDPPWRVSRQGGRKSATAPADRLIRAMAAEQSGVVARRQLLRRGVTERQVDRRVASGGLVAIHRGVYAVGHRVLVADRFRM